MAWNESLLDGRTVVYDSNMILLSVPEVLLNVAVDSDSTVLESAHRDQQVLQRHASCV
jgi:hypothetical protein